MVLSTSLPFVHIHRLLCLVYHIAQCKAALLLWMYVLRINDCHMSETVSIVVSVVGLSGCKSTIYVLYLKKFLSWNKHVILTERGYIEIPLQLGKLHLISWGTKFLYRFKPWRSVTPKPMYTVVKCNSSLLLLWQDIMNREKEDQLPLMQVGFIDSICLPIYEVLYLNIYL
jgi:hypothetical protein